MRPALGYAGAVYLIDGKTLRLDFEYSKERVARLKGGVGGAKFHPDGKFWTLPVAKLPELMAQELFSDSAIRYYIDDLDLELSEGQRVSRRAEAQEQIRRNPFSVAREQLSVVPVDVEIVLNPARGAIVARCRYLSKASRLLGRVRGVLSSRREGGYLVQAHRLPEILKELRNKKFSFAVSAEASELLRRGAEVRAGILEHGHGTLAEYREALLSPIVLMNPDDESFFSLVDWVPEHLQVLFPNVDTFPERRKRAASLSLEELPEIFDRAINCGIKLWCDQTISSFLSSTLPREGEKLRREREERRERNQHFKSMADAVLDTSLLSQAGVGERLFPHQRIAVNWLLEMPRAFLGDDMGLGKTLSVLTYFEMLKARDEVDLLLVICPNSLKRNWLREAEQWFPASRLLLHPDKKADRITFFRQLRLGARLFDGLVINFEAVRLPDVVKGVKEVLQNRRVLLCVDESQRIKNPRSKSFLALAELSNHCLRRVLLSGTPTPRDISDIWAQVYLLDDGQRLGRNFYKWLSQVAELGNSYSEVAVRRYKPEEVKESLLRVQELLLRRRKEDVLQLPEKTFTVRDVELAGDQRKFYEEIRRELLVRVTSLSGSTYLKEISSVLEEYLRAVQVCSNPRLVDPSWSGDPAKFLECDEIVGEIVEERGEKLVIWTNYLGNVAELCTRYQHLGAKPFSGEVDPAERDLTIEEFQKGESVKILVAIPAAGGVGITLTAAQTAVYLDKTWNAEHYLQSVDRIHRIGQRGTVNIISLHASKVDALIARNLRRKEKELKRVLGDSDEAGEFISREELIEAVR
jgi:SNF2 family DNA or RNA helicase